MIRFRKFLPIVAILAGIAMLGVPARARADFELAYNLNNTGWIIAPSTSVTVDNLTITVTASGGTSSPLTLLDISVQSQGLGPNASGSLQILATMTGLLTGPPPLTLVTKFSDTSNPGVTNPLAETWIDQNNNDFGGGPTPPESGAPTNIVLDTGAVGPISPLTRSYTFSATSPYSITSGLSFGFSQNDGLSLDSNDRITPSPAPAGIVLAIAGLPVLGLGTWVKRRQCRISA